MPFHTLTTYRWYYVRAAHLFADTDEELHAFAEKIGLKRIWFQDRTPFHHYDLTVSKRRQALRAGAIPVGRKEEVALVKEKRTVQEARSDSRADH